MEKRLIIANWKARKTTIEATLWLDTLKQANLLTVTYPHAVLLAVPFTLLSVLSHEVRQRNLPLMLCSQDISAFPQGSYTGEVPAELIKEFADYGIIGHSERREQLHEKEELLASKVDQALAGGITPIYCVQNTSEAIPQGVTIAAYEPPGSIGNGEAASLDNVLDVVKQITASSQQALSILYGGSVDAENIQGFMTAPEVSGVLVGTKSIDASDFVALLTAAL
jgi:triosephosphate isomerase